MGDSKAKAQRRREYPPLPEPLPNPAVDNHTHLESVVGTNFELALAQLRLAAASGINRIVQVGCEIPSARWTDRWLRHLDAVVSTAAALAQPTDAVVSTAAELAQPTDAVVSTAAALAQPATMAQVVGAIAIHPNEAVRHAKIYEVAADGLTPEDRPHHEIPLTAAITEIADLAKNNPRIRAIGETGMDLFRAGPQGAKVQRQAFRDHIAIAKELNLALQIHDREAHQQVIDTLKQDGAPEKTVFHCFSGDAQMAQVCAENGWYMSFAGPVTYKANDDLRKALQTAPHHLILAETDAPYLTAHPYRGQPNAPYAVNYTIRAMADIKGISLDEMCQTVSQNSETVYGPW